MELTNTSAGHLDGAARVSPPRAAFSFRTTILAEACCFGLLPVRESGNEDYLHLPPIEDLHRMRDDQHRFLGLLGRTPARLTVEQTAWVLNCQPHDVPVLVAAKLLKPLGAPRANSVKYFAAAEVLEAAQERAWLSKITQTLGQHWQRKNARNGVVRDSAQLSDSVPISSPPVGLN